ncbi:cell wall metabolism sensor histidine kinase WalK [Metallumcola ferriviriculae]|uniref:histidine kinase n=1 Tax=Metallumcola ferriviriculae TaxID=3039180 RepID=A0AAU0UN39_9FIRM|nr:cell wall metabolism sensor histidine kinase WalK [Desulfitibacteraceae bacterium MK1]
MNLRRSMVGKMWLGTVILVIVILLLLGVLLTHLLENFYYDQKEAELVRQGSLLAHSLAEGDETTMNNLDSLEEYLNATVMVVNRSGLVRACGGMMGMRPGMRMQSGEVDRVLSGEIITNRGFDPRFDRAVLSAAVPIEKGDKVIGAAMLYTPVEPISETIAHMRRIVLLSGAVAILLVTVLGFFMTRKLSLPLLQMKEQAHRMASGDFKGRVPAESDDEIGLLGRSFNYMAEQLNSSVMALSQEKEKLSNIVTSMSDGVVTFSSSGEIMFLNQQAKALLKAAGFAGEEEIVNLFSQWIKQVLISGNQLNEEMPARESILAVRISPLWEDKSPAGVVVLLQDVTKERELERLRREFLASVSHELRTPLTYLQGYAEAMQDGLAESPGEREQIINIFLEETLRLRRLVNDLLDLNQLENGQLVMNFGVVDLNMLVKRVTDKMQPLAQGHEISLDKQLYPEKVAVRGDFDRLQQVLVNLLDNALQHTPAHGRIVVSVDKVESGIIRVKDSGAGIHEAEVDHIWERFYKVDKARTRTQAGTGLGLAIVKNIIKAHSGEVAVISKPGIGAEFSVAIPLSEPSEEKKAVQNA